MTVGHPAELDMLADMLVLTHPAGKRSATLVCSGPPAGDLFSAMNGVSLVNIETGVPFLDGLRRQ